MTRGRLRTGLVVAMVLGAWPACAVAAPASGPHETLDNQFSTARPNAPSGFSFTGRYHAANDPAGPPPYMRSMVFHPPAGLRYDTSVPGRCAASDVELAVLGASACPADSRLGGGTSTAAFLGGTPSTVDVDFLNNTDEQIILARSPGLATVSRGQIRPDGSIAWASPTCFPSLQPVGCPADDVLQLESSISVPPYTRSTGTYMTTPPTCPATHHWETPVQLTWADGSVDTVTTEQPCRPRR